MKVTRLVYALATVVLLSYGCGCSGRSWKKMPDGNVLIQYSGYEVLYSPENLIPEWVRYELTAAEADGPYSRKGKSFRRDEALRARQADSDDYRNSGWSRGHLAPAGDFKWSDEAMWETFYYTNCCPQNQSLNAGQWNTLEQKVRGWAKRFGRVTVITGPLIGDNIHGSIGYRKVTVPDAFFKVISDGKQSIAFVMYNKEENANMQKCAMSVDRLEEMSGIDFFTELEDALEDRMEAAYSLKYWGL